MRIYKRLLNMPLRDWIKIESLSDMMPSYILALIPKIMHQKTGSFGISCLQDLKRNWIESL